MTAPVSPPAGDWTGRRVTDRAGRPLGTLEQVYVERGTDRPTWGMVAAGRRHRFVPLDRAAPHDGDVEVPVPRSDVRRSPAVPPGARLTPETEERLRGHYVPSWFDDDTADAGVDDTGYREGSLLAVPRSRGAVSGALLILLGLWGTFVPFVGPYFDYHFGPDATWTYDTDRLWLSILPGLATVLGGLLLALSANRLVGGLGAGLAIVGGLWFVLGPVVSQLWDGGGPAAPIGTPSGDAGLAVAEQLGHFYGLGALVVAVAGFALGRLSVRSVRDVR